MISVSDAGENCISVAPGANAMLSVELVDQRANAIAAARIVLAQLEVPLQSVQKAARIAAEAGVPFVLNPAPAASLPGELLERLHCITPNAGEATALTGVDVVDVRSAAEAGKALAGRGVQMTVITLGEQGAVLYQGGEMQHFPAERVQAVDTTAAGDTFNGVFVAALNAGKTPDDAVELAVRAATLTVQRPGAIAAIPFAREYL